jgi:hypothetical protein
MALIFVHGITVRRERFDRLLKSVVNGFHETGCGLAVSGCYWGDLGRSPSYTGVSIPGFSAGVRGIGMAEAVQREAPLMTLLVEEPLAELADLRDGEEFTLETAGFRPLPPEVVQRNEALRGAETPVQNRILDSAVTFADPDNPIDADQIITLIHGVFSVAARADRRLDAQALCAPMIRAITAGLCGIGSSADDLFTEFRWNQAAGEVEAALNDRLGGQRGIFSDLGSTALTAALRHGLRNRVMPGLSLFLGDVLSWFRNREAILNRVEEAVIAAGPDEPLVLLGHSLGGVIAFEYSAQATRDIELLATVGSQVGLFGELGVLHASAQSATGNLAAPDRVRSWCNLYDPDDALSFLAAPVFDAVTDIELDTRAPFPASHSEYWNLADTYQKLTAAVTEL